MSFFGKLIFWKAMQSKNRVVFRVSDITKAMDKSLKDKNVDKLQEELVEFGKWIEYKFNSKKKPIKKILCQRNGNRIDGSVYVEASKTKFVSYEFSITKSDFDCI